MTSSTASEPADRADSRAKLLLDLATSITGTLDLQEALDQSLSAMRQLITFGGGAIQLIDNGALVAAATDPPAPPEAYEVRIPLGQGVSGTIALTGEAIYIPDIVVDERVPEAARKAGVSSGVRTYFGVPLILQGKPIGVLQVDAPDVDAFTGEERALVLAFLPTITAAVQNARIYDHEREIANKLRETDQLKRDFISIVSHELRTPLTIMLGMSGTIARRASELPTDDIIMMAKRSSSAAQRLQRLIDDLLYAADLDRGHVGVQSVPIDLAAVLHAVTSEEEERLCPVEVDVEPDLPAVRGDDQRLHQVLSNLIGNAEKFSPPGSTIRVRAFTDGPKVRVSVIDQGAGIDPEDRDAIFELFAQADAIDTRPQGGLGIGLYVVKRLCDAMGAGIEVGDAADGRGAQFIVTLERVEP